MKTLFTIITLFAFLFGNSAFSAEPLEVNKLLHAKGDFCISDGSSVYIFSPNGKFKSTPVGLSGRTIEGTWTNDSTKIYIKGKWGWMNGLSSNNDFREMDIHIGSVSDKVTIHSVWAKKRIVHDAYFIITRLEKKK